MIASPEIESRAQPAFLPTVPDGIQVYNDRLFFRGIDLMSIVQRPIYNRERIEMPTTPMYIRYLPALRQNYEQLHRWFEVARATTGFPGSLTVAYASKANPAEPVIRTLLQAGAAPAYSATCYGGTL